MNTEISLYKFIDVTHHYTGLIKLANITTLHTVVKDPTGHFSLGNFFILIAPTFSAFKKHHKCLELTISVSWAVDPSPPTSKWSVASLAPSR